MAVDVVGRTIVPGDFILIFAHRGSKTQSQIEVAEILTNKTVNGIRTIKTIVISEEQMRNHRLENYSMNTWELRRYQDEHGEVPSLEQLRENKVEQLLQLSQEIRRKFNIE